MNEFTGKSKEQLKSIKTCMEAYKEGCNDTLKILNDFLQELTVKTDCMWIQKIAVCQGEIDKHD